MRSKSSRLRMIPACRIPAPIESRSCSMILLSARIRRGLGSPKGDTAPVSYPVICRTSSAPAVVRRETCKWRRNFGQATFPGPGINTRTKSPSSRRKTNVRTIWVGSSPRSRAACSRERRGFSCTCNWYEMSRLSRTRVTDVSDVMIGNCIANQDDSRR
jgi:hypothetical protein